MNKKKVHKAIMKAMPEYPLLHEFENGLWAQIELVKGDNNYRFESGAISENGKIIYEFLPDSFIEKELVKYDRLFAVALFNEAVDSDDERLSGLLNYLFALTATREEMDQNVWETESATYTKKEVKRLQKKHGLLMVF